MASKALERHHERGELTDEQVQLVKSQIAPVGTSDEELALFIGQCRRTGLDPFARQIHLIERTTNVQDAQGNWSKLKKRMPEVSIDGLRLIAERTGRYAGQTPPQWCGPDGQWVDVWLKPEPPAAARVGVYKVGFSEPVYFPATYAQCAQTNSRGEPNAVWKRMPAHMLAIRAETFALRKCFPLELSGLYTADEMGDDHDGTLTMPKAVPANVDATTGEIIEAEVVEAEVVEPSSNSNGGEFDDDGFFVPDESGNSVGDDVIRVLEHEHIALLMHALDVAAVAGMREWTPEHVLSRAKRKWADSNIETIEDLTEDQVATILNGLEAAQRRAGL